MRLGSSSRGVIQKGYCRLPGVVCWVWTNIDDLTACIRTHVRRGRHFSMCSEWTMGLHCCDFLGVLSPDTRVLFVHRGGASSLVAIEEKGGH